MKKKYLNRIKFIDKNKMIIDETHNIFIKRNNKGRVFIYENKIYENEEKLFNHIDEISTTTSVGGGYEGPGLAPANKLMKRTFLPYDTIVEKVEKLVKDALIEEYVKEHPRYELIELYRKENGKNSEKHIKDVEEGINIVYATILPAQVPNYYRDKNDYNGDGVPNINKENEGLLDVRYDAASEDFKKRNKEYLSKDPAGVKMMDAATQKAKNRQANPTNAPTVQLGRDIEFLPNTGNVAKDSRSGVAALGFALKENQSKNMKHLKFKFNKKNLNEPNVLIESVPNKVKIENTIFEMEDNFGNNFLIEWKNNEGTILRYKNILEEQKSLSKVENLFEKLSNKKENRKRKKIDFDYFTKGSE